MSKFNQIMNALREGASFSWNFDGIQSPEPQGSLNAMCDVSEKGIIGYHTQVFLARAFLTEGITITYMQEENKIKIYY